MQATTDPSRTNLHASVVVLRDRGVLIRGASQSGKTTLSLALIERTRRVGHFARLVSDDQVFVEASHGRLVATAPATIAGLVEVRGREPQRLDTLDAAVVDLVVDLVEAPLAPRLAADETTTIAGVELSLLVLEARNADGAWPALASLIGLPPFR